MSRDCDNAERALPGAKVGSGTAQAVPPVAESAHIAVDLGAGSGRVVLGLVGRELYLEEVHRFPNPVEERDGHLRWDPRLLLREIQTGIRVASESLARSYSDTGSDARAEAGVRPVPGHSPPRLTIGVDTWGVDYCLLDASHQLIEDPICYRDPRTAEVVADVLNVIDADRLYDKTGIQLLHINTLFQLWTHVRSGNWPENVAAICMMPDLFHLWLSGKHITEYTEATTSQMLRVRDKGWDADLMSMIGLPAAYLPRPTRPGTRLGKIRGKIAAADIEVVVPASHDTASAIAGTPLAEGWAFISCGTWALVGLELQEPELGPLARRYEFSNEGGAEDTIAFLKNVTGLWILDECVKRWREEGLAKGYDDLLARPAEVVPGSSFIVPDDPRFFGMGNMPEQILGFLQETQQAPVQGPAEIARLVMDSLALRFAQIIDQLSEATGTTASNASTGAPGATGSARATGGAIRGIHIVGGGSRNEVLMQATANASQLPVVAGPVEATALGSVLVQAIGVGSLLDLAAARRWVRDQVSLRTYVPRHQAEWATARNRFREIAARG